MTDDNRQEFERFDDTVSDAIDDEIEGVLPLPYSITSYGADYPVDGLVKRLRAGAIYVPDFQRGFVWTQPQSSRFIESLLLGLPVPGVFLAKDDDTQKLMVIDGQQRLLTLRFFYDGVFASSGRQFDLRGILPPYAGATYNSLSESDRLRLDDSIIHATIVQQDQPSEDRSSVYHIFERLNTGGTPLSPQEIRTCVYHGPFVALLKTLNADDNWRAVFGGVNTRMKDQELILRFLALNEALLTYREPMKAFLNSYMGRHRRVAEGDARRMELTFATAIRVARECLGDRAFRRERALNASVFDSVMVGLAQRLAKGPIQGGCDEVRHKYEELLSTRDYETATGAATSGTERVTSRLRLAIAAFANIR